MHTLEFSGPGGSTVYIQPVDTLQLHSKKSVSEKAREELEPAMKCIAAASEAVQSTFQNSAAVPSSVSIKFQVGVKGKGEFFIASVAASANFEITATWSRDEGRT